MLEFARKLAVLSAPEKWRFKEPRHHVDWPAHKGLFCVYPSGTLETQSGGGDAFGLLEHIFQLDGVVSPFPQHADHPKESG